MPLPITLGKKSDDKPFETDLLELPHLFVSYSEPAHIHRFYTDLLHQLNVSIKARLTWYAFAGAETIFTKETKAVQQLGFSLLMRNEVNEMSTSRLAFLQSLQKEYKRRQQLVFSGKPYYLYPLVVFMDDLIDLVVTKQKTTGLYFLELLRYGPEMKIHFIMGSTRSYRGLARQLIQFQKEGEPSILDNYMPELVISPEELLFYKRPEELNYTRLFSLHEGI